MGFTEILTIIFVVLKLTGTINWSWWLVFLPEIIAGIVYVGFIIYWIHTTRQVDKIADKWLNDIDFWR